MIRSGLGSSRTEHARPGRPGLQVGVEELRRDIIASNVREKIAKKHSHSPAVELTDYPGRRSHFTIGGREEVADYALDCAVEHAAAAAPAPEEAPEAPAAAPGPA